MGRRGLLIRLILASQSPRRSELLRSAGLSFETYAPDVNEECDLPTADSVEQIALRKAESAFVSHPGCYILAADTLVSVDEEKLGKPRDEADAIRMLTALSGRTHQVYTGVAVINPGHQIFSARDCTDVTFDRMTEQEILSYVRTGEPMDKAGAYALQGRAGLWVTHLDGNPSSVIGLSLSLVHSLLIRAGYPL